MAGKQEDNRTKLVVYGNSVYEIDLECYRELSSSDKIKYFPELQNDEKMKENQAL